MITNKFPSSNLASKNQYIKNLHFLSKFNERLVSNLQSLDLNIEICSLGDDAISVVLNGEQLVENLQSLIAINYSAQMTKPDRALMARINNTLPPVDSKSLLASVVDTEDLVALPRLINLRTHNEENRILCRDYVLLGALSLCYVPYLLQIGCLDSVLLVESDLDQFAATLHLIDLEEYVTHLKRLGIGFHFIFQSQVNDLCFDFFNYYTEINPLALHGLCLLRSPKLAPPLIELRAWIHSRDGLLEHSKGFLGNDTDEINQTLHAIWNSKLIDGARMLKADVLPDNYPVILVASGPSLNAQIQWLRDNHSTFTIIAAGSSIGALLRAGIHVDAVVLLEMGSVVFRDISDLVIEGYKLSEIILFASLTIDPRIAANFKEVVFYHRPLSTVSALFPAEYYAHLPQAGPQAANAALEVVLQLGSRKIALFGCDFGATSPLQPRALGAIGSSNRFFDMPVRGNLGRTIYTSSELSVTRQLFENAIALYGAHIVCIGEGTIRVAQANFEYAHDATNELLSFASSSSVLHDAICALPPRLLDVRQLTDSIDLILSCNDTSFDEVIKLLNSHTCWSHCLSLSLAKYVCVSFGDKLSHAELVHQRLTRFLIFFALQPLHDCPLELEQWHILRDQCIESINQINAYIKEFLVFLSFLASAKALPSWDSSWIKTRIQSSY